MAAIYAAELGGEPVAPWEVEAARHLVASANEIRLLGRLGVQALAEQFNSMAARLQESYTNLEQKVESRTRDLSEALEQSKTD